MCGVPGDSPPTQNEKALRRCVGGLICADEAGRGRLRRTVLRGVDKLNCTVVTDATRTLDTPQTADSRENNKLLLCTHPSVRVRVRDPDVSLSLGSVLFVQLKSSTEPGCSLDRWRKVEQETTRPWPAVSGGDNQGGEARRGE